MKTFLASALCLALCCGAAPSRAEDLPLFDLDDLTFESQAIVEGRVTASRETPKAQQLDLQVARSIFGPLSVGQVVTVEGAELYLKRVPGESGNKIFPRTQRLSVGDQLTLFLFRTKQQKRRNAWAKQNKWSLVLSGVRLMNGPVAHDFYQRMNPGDYIEGEVASRNFKRDVENSVRRVEELKTLLAKLDSPDDAPVLARWRTERQSLRETRFGWASFGPIFQAVEEKLKRLDSSKQNTQGSP